MNKDHFVKYLQEPETLDKDSITDLTQLIQEFPYCQSARILLSINLFKEKNIHFETELKTTAVFAGDRYMLKKHIDRINHANVKIVLHDEYKEEVEETDSEPVKPKEETKAEESNDKLVGEEAIDPDEEVLAEAAPETLDPAERIARLRRIVEERIKEIEAEAKGKPVKPAKDDSGKTKQQLIDEFIMNDPGITRGGETFFNPIVAAKESIVDQENIVSETLAQIYFDQQHYEKAITVYEKLSLKFPEKSTYFAGLIEKAKTELKT